MNLWHTAGQGYIDNRPAEWIRIGGARYSGNSVQGSKGTKECSLTLSNEDCSCEVNLPQLFRSGTRSIFRQTSVPIITVNVLLKDDAPADVQNALTTLLDAPVQIEAACVQRIATVIIEQAAGCSPAGVLISS